MEDNPDKKLKLDNKMQTEHDDKVVKAVQQVMTKIRTVEARLEWVLSKEIMESKIKSNSKMISPKYILQVGSETTSWQLRIYTNEESKDIISLFLVFGDLNDPKNRKVSFVASMKDANGKLVNSSTCVVNASKALEFSGGYGFSKFVKRDDLVYVNKKITLVCDLIIPVEKNQRIRVDTEDKVKYDSKENESIFLKNMKSMYNLASFSDLIIFCGDQKFLCHKNVLASRSDVFKDLLESGNIEGEIKITDVSPDIFKIIIDHIYTGKIPKDITTNAAELFRLARMYNLNILAKACEIDLIGQLTDGNATDTLVTLDTHRSTYNVKNEVMKYIIANAMDIMDTDKFKEFSNKHPDLMLEVFRCAILNQNKEVLETMRKEGIQD